MNEHLYQIKYQIGKNAPSIMTAIAVGGLVTTSLSAIRASFVAKDILEEERSERYRLYKSHAEPISFKDAVLLVWPEYLPTAISGMTTIFCILGANSIHLKRNAAMAGLYTVAVEGLREYQEKVVEIVGKKRHEDVMEEIAQDHLRNDPVEDKLVIFSGGDCLFYDDLTGRYFMSSVEKVKSAVNDFNFDLLDEMFKPVNDFYDLLGLDEVEGGRQTGFNVDNGKLQIRFTTKLVNSPDSKWHNEPCIVLQYVTEPRYL